MDEVIATAGGCCVCKLLCGVVQWGCCVCKLLCGVVQWGCCVCKLLCGGGAVMTVVVCV